MPHLLKIDGTATESIEEVSDSFHAVADALLPILPDGWRLVGYSPGLLFGPPAGSLDQRTLNMPSSIAIEMAAKLDKLLDSAS